MIGHILQMCSKDSEFSLCPVGSYEGQKMKFSVKKACHLNSIYISKIRQIIWLMRIWLGLSCRCSIRFWNVFSSLESRVQKLRLLAVTWTPSTFQGKVNKWYAKMWLGRPCGCPMRIQKLHFAPSG